ncbi:MAG TPA: hypothetical protein VJB60_05005 [Candidatus Peribacterales bacterium]|nr:hypothetical protein [Candidatus Peribacterales bacterium]
MRLPSIIFLLLIFSILPLHANAEEMSSAESPVCEDLNGQERAECRTRLEIQGAGQSLPLLINGGTRCRPAQKLTTLQRQWCLLLGSIENRKISGIDESRAFRRVKEYEESAKAMLPEFAKSVEEKKQETLDRKKEVLERAANPLNARKARVFFLKNRQEMRLREAAGRKQKNASYENRLSGPASKTIDTGSKKFQDGTLRYFRNRPRIRKD